MSVYAAKYLGKFDTCDSHDGRLARGLQIPHSTPPPTGTFLFIYFQSDRALRNRPRAIYGMRRSTEFGFCLSESGPGFTHQHFCLEQGSFYFIFFLISFAFRPGHHKSLRQLLIQALEPDWLCFLSGSRCKWTRFKLTGPPPLLQEPAIIFQNYLLIQFIRLFKSVAPEQSVTSWSSCSTLPHL